MYLNVNTKSSNFPMASNIVVFTPSTDSTNCLTVCNDDIAWFIFKSLSGSSGNHYLIYIIHILYS
jgi:hypothetical protein